MRIHLAGMGSALKKQQDVAGEAIYALESFYYWQDWETRFLSVWKGFLLDSGAFTFMMKGAVGAEFRAYVDRFVDFIKANGIQYYFEMDVDSVLGYDEVRRLRRDIENRTGRPSIPVWHISRGIADLKATCKDYSYIAIGQNVNAKGQYCDLTRDQQRRIIDIAHENGAMIHGLGRTSQEALQSGFDSIDSTTWLNGVKYNSIQAYRNGKIRHLTGVGRKTILTSDQKLAMNLRAWVKMQQYAEKYL